ncbi:membrane progestin receptor beta [Biomphalaria glabrata]|uniref:Membrane progestin receptor beta-like n=1 Tax=Biomphalaria glabrata TaxID=6526 RepID=A0A2C9MA54_BIOGL|nr:membrane progestin receptor beta-like [Biomphalaria glabrata]
MTLNYIRSLGPRMLSYLQSDNNSRQVELLTSHQMPELLKAPYIFTGYRPVGQPWKYYFSSLLTLHNESVNVWTHVGGFWLVLLRLCHYFTQLTTYDKMIWPVVCFGFCSLLNLILSSVAHLLHSKSCWYHYVLFLMDYMGVTTFCFGSGVAAMYATSSKFYHEFMYTAFLPVNVFLGLFSFYTCCLAKFHLTHQHTKRKVSMMAGIATHGFFAASPMFSRYMQCLSESECSLASLNHLTLFLMLTFICAVSFSVHVPESLMPGSFDVIGHGHQIFHILAVLVMLGMVRAMDIDINETKTGEYLEPNLLHITLSLMVLLVLEVATLMYYAQRSVLRCVARDALDSAIVDANEEQTNSPTPCSESLSRTHSTSNCTNLYLDIDEIERKKEI